MLGNSKNSPSTEKQLEVLYDHYKDSFEQCSEHRKQRDRFLIFILIVISLQLFQIFSPDSAELTIGEFVAKRLELESPVDVSFIKSIIWFLLLGFSVRYFQSCITLERQYTYVHELEKQLCTVFQGEVFTREGKSYLKNYPTFSNWAHILYTWIFPLLLLLIVGAKLFNEIRLGNGFSFLSLVNVSFAIFIVVSTVLYLQVMHPRKPKRIKKKQQTKVIVK